MCGKRSSLTEGHEGGEDRPEPTQRSWDAGGRLRRWLASKGHLAEREGAPLSQLRFDDSPHSLR